MSNAVVVICVDSTVPGAVQFPACPAGYATTSTISYVDPAVDNAVPDDVGQSFMAGFWLPLSLYITARLIGEIISFVKRY